MPLTTELYPGKKISINGNTFFTKPESISYNGSLNEWAGGNLNSTESNKVFAIKNGVRLSQNQALINSDYVDLQHNNKDLPYYIQSRNAPLTYEETFDLVNPMTNINLPKPRRTKRINGGQF